MIDIARVVEHARQLAVIAGDWNLDEVEIDGKMEGIYDVRDEFVVALTDLRSGELVVVPGWRPIETAPRGSGESGPNSVSHPEYISPPRLLLWKQGEVVIGYYDWYYHPGYGNGSNERGSAWVIEGTLLDDPDIDPTHWMPLPEGPVLQRREEPNEATS